MRARLAKFIEKRDRQRECAIAGYLALNQHPCHQVQSSSQVIRVALLR
jgi:hypothetical protein